MAAGSWRVALGILFATLLVAVPLGTTVAMLVTKSLPGVTFPGMWILMMALTWALSAGWSFDAVRDH